MSLTFQPTSTATTISATDDRARSARTSHSRGSGTRSCDPEGERDDEAHREERRRGPTASHRERRPSVSTANPKHTANAGTAGSRNSAFTVSPSTRRVRSARSTASPRAPRAACSGTSSELRPVHATRAIASAASASNPTAARNVGRTPTIALDGEPLLDRLRSSASGPSPTSRSPK